LIIVKTTNGLPESPDNFTMKDPLRVRQREQRIFNPMIPMPGRIHIILAFILSLLAAAAVCPAAEPVEFRSSFGDVMLKGALTKPPGGGPFPAVVLLHGCGGITRRDNVWADTFRSWGYVSLQVDSFRPRGIDRVCSNRYVSRDMSRKRIQDAYDAKAYLMGVSLIDRNRILLVGWSHGGGVVLNVLDRANGDPFRAAVAFYPYCDPKMDALNAPLLILIGEKDDWTPAQRCVERVPQPGKSLKEVTLKVYPGAYHGFDRSGSDTYVLGVNRIHRLLYEPEAAADSKKQVRMFFDKYAQ
jgi:dienelactone hydrolase